MFQRGDGPLCDVEERRKLMTAAAKGPFVSEVVLLKSIDETACFLRKESQPVMQKA
jgi:hypothetical protein